MQLLKIGQQILILFNFVERELGYGRRQIYSLFLLFT